MQPDVLAKTLENTFWGVEPQMLSNIHDRWLRVLKLIVKGKGSNQLVEIWRKKDDNVDDLVYVEDDEKIRHDIVLEDWSDEENEDIDDSVKEENEDNDNDVENENEEKANNETD